MSEDIPLSPTGHKHRERILRLAQKEARLRRQRRRGWQIAFGTGAIIALTALTVFRMDRPSTSRIADAPPPATPALSPVAVTNHVVSAPRPAGIIITRVLSEPDISKRLAVRSQKPSWHMLDDDELLNQLNAAGCPAGLAWINGRELVLFRHPPAGEHS